ncbi:hypothetical protein [Nitrospina watsonii]|uniref:Uncharacterized protein n=1 Tax=Nitrospina watsonii TaxID=1323948 RepID=A0ABN8W0X0_9BACT|nr:hypothetical protein [Nitrospina watsonii]CAI2719645.1 protein of unknown function [Nitrospina watsonii]
MKKIQALTQFVTRNLNMQLLIALSQSPESSSRSQSPYALGYIFGFVSGGFDSFQLRQKGDQFDVLIDVYEHVFEMEGADYLNQSLHLNWNDAFRQGNQCGWEEMKRLLHRKESAIGLVRYLIHGEVTTAMNPDMSAHNAALAYAG